MKHHFFLALLDIISDSCHFVQSMEGDLIVNTQDPGLWAKYPAVSFLGSSLEKQCPLIQMFNLSTALHQIQ
jgi:hypothetical protein